MLYISTFQYISGSPEQCVIHGDVNGDSNLTITDVTSLINYLLNGDVSSIRVDLADVNNDGGVTITDVTSLINGLLNGPAN